MTVLVVVGQAVSIALMWRVYRARAVFPRVAGRSPEGDVLNLHRAGRP